MNFKIFLALTAIATCSSACKSNNAQIAGPAPVVIPPALSNDTYRFDSSLKFGSVTCNGNNYDDLSSFELSMSGDNENAKITFSNSNVNHGGVYTSTFNIIPGDGPHLNLGFRDQFVSTSEPKTQSSHYLEGLNALVADSTRNESFEVTKEAVDGKIVLTLTSEQDHFVCFGSKTLNYTESTQDVLDNNSANRVELKLVKGGDFTADELDMLAAADDQKAKEFAKEQLADRRADARSDAFLGGVDIKAQTAALQEKLNEIKEQDSKKIEQAEEVGHEVVEERVKTSPTIQSAKDHHPVKTQVELVEKQLELKKQLHKIQDGKEFNKKAFEQSQHELDEQEVALTQKIDMTEVLKESEGETL